MFVESYGRVAVQGSSFSPRVGAVLDRGTAQLRRRRLLLAQRLPHLADVRRPQLAGALHPAVGDPGRRPAALRPARRERPPHAHAARSSAPAGGRSASCRRTAGRGRRAPATTATTRSTTAATSATAARTSACRRCPTSTRSGPCSASSSPSATGRRCSPRSTSSRATRRGRGSRGSIPWDDVGDGSIFDRIPAEESTQAALFGDAERARAAYGHSIEYSLRTLFSFVQRYGDDDTRARRPRRPPARDARHRPGRRPRRADLGHRPRPEGDGPDRRLGLAGRHAAEPAGAGLADGRVPRPLPHRVRVDEPLAVRRRRCTGRGCRRTHPASSSARRAS